MAATPCPVCATPVPAGAPAVTPPGFVSDHAAPCGLPCGGGPLAPPTRAHGRFHGRAPRCPRCAAPGAPPPFDR